MRRVPEALTKYSMYRARIIPSYLDAQSFQESEWLLSMHEENWEARLLNLESMQRAIVPVLDRHLSPGWCERALEVGCGIGFFDHFFAPPWLKKRLVSFDIHKPSLTLAKELSPDMRYFQADAYHLPFAEGAFDMVVGLSALDSVIYPEEVLREIGRVLAPAGKMILFQDCVPSLHVYQFDQDSRDATLRYHQELVRLVNASSSWRIVEGEDAYLEEVAFASRQELLDRVTNPQKREMARWAFAIFCDLGMALTASTALSISRKINIIRQFMPGLSMNQLKRLVFSNDVLEAVRLTYLVAEKVG